MNTHHYFGSSGINTMAYQVGLLFCSQDSEIASSFKRMLERLLDIDIRLFNGDDIENFVDENSHIFVFATPTFLKERRSTELIDGLLLRSVEMNKRGNIIPVLLTRVKLPWGLKSKHPLTLYRLTCERAAEEYVEIFDGIKDENTLNKFDRYMMNSLWTAFPASRRLSS